MPLNTVTAQRHENGGMSTIWLPRKFRKIRKWILKIGFQLFTNRKPTKKKKKKKAFFSSFDETPKLIIHPNPARTRIYDIACWVKYLVDSPENIWGCHNESMFVESAESMFVEFSSASPSMADRRELQGSNLAAEPWEVAGARASDFGLCQCVGWRHHHQRDSPQSSSSHRSFNHFQLRFHLEFLSRFGKYFFNASNH